MEMAINGLNDIYRVPFIKKERMPEKDERKKEKRKSDNRKNDEQENQGNEKGKIDIRV